MKSFLTLLTLLVALPGAKAQNWTRTAGPVEDHVFDLCVDSSGILYAVTTIGVNRSTDGGELWTRPFSWPRQSTNNRIVVAANGNIIASMDHGIFVSTDQGTTFTASLFHDSIINPVLQFARTGSGRVFATMSLTFGMSDDNGLTWENAPRQGISSEPQLIVASNDTVIAHERSKFYVSYDDGSTWQRPFSGLGATPKNLIILPDGSWIGVMDFAILRFNVTKNVWGLIEGGSFDEKIYGASMMHDGSILVSTSEAVLQLNNSVWSNVSAGFGVDTTGEYFLVSRFVVDPKTGSFYAATRGAAVWKGNSVLLDRKGDHHSTSHLQIFPNPLASSSTIRFMLDRPSEVSIRITDHLGRFVLTENQKLNKGPHEVPLDVQHLPAGSYILELSAGNWRETKMIAVVK